MPRRSLDRDLPLLPPAPEIACKYLLSYPPRLLHDCPAAFPPLDACHLFGHRRPLELEVGSGRGDFLCSLAQQHPANGFVGVELGRKAVYQAVATAHAAKLDNLRFVRADVRLLYPLLAPASLEAVYLHFPDPHPRPKFQRRRLFSAPFLDAMHRALRPGGRLSVMTDHREAFFAMLELAEGDRRWRKAHAERYLVGYEAEVKSRFQQLWEGHGLATLRFELTKQPPE